LSNFFKSEGADWWESATENANIVEEAIKSAKGFGPEIASTKLSDLNKKVGNKHD